MIGKTWIAMMVGAFVLVGGLATVAAAGSMSGDCDQTQDKIQDQLQLKDGSCINETLESTDASGGLNGDCLQNMTQDKLQLKDGSCIDTLASEDDSAALEPWVHFWNFYYVELQDETPYM